MTVKLKEMLQNIMNKESIQNNISIIWNNYLLNKDVNDSNNQINNSSINNIKNQIISDDINKYINNDQRNHLNIPILDYLQNNKKNSYHSFITDGSSKDVTENLKDFKNDSNNFLSQNKNSNIYILQKIH